MCLLFTQRYIYNSTSFILKYNSVAIFKRHELKNFIIFPWSLRFALIKKQCSKQCSRYLQEKFLIKKKWKDCWYYWRYHAWRAFEISAAKIWIDIIQVYIYIYMNMCLIVRYLYSFARDIRRQPFVGFTVNICPSTRSSLRHYFEIFISHEMPRARMWRKAYAYVNKLKRQFITD